jgi:transposase InsO family protein
LTRLSLYNQDLFCGAQAISWELEEQNVQPLPSLRTINRILSRNDLTHRRTGRYEPKGVPYPALPAKTPNYRHQADFVGPRHLRAEKGPLRFYSMNVVDLATSRCGTQPLLSRSGNAVYEAFWAIWGRLGVPRHLQVDNEMVFYGSPTHPRGMGPLIRLCLHYGIELWFIPSSEPWRNGVVEKFNDHYQQKFLHRSPMQTEQELRAAALAFEHKHNSRYRYSKLNGKTPLQALAQSSRKPLRFPPQQPAPQAPLEKPETGRYHLIRLIRSDCKLDIFGERFGVPPDLQYEYVVATIDVKEQKLNLFHDQLQVEEFEYRLR